MEDRKRRPRRTTFRSTNWPPLRGVGFHSVMRDGAPCHGFETPMPAVSSPRCAGAGDGTPCRSTTLRGNKGDGMARSGPGKKMAAITPPVEAFFDPGPIIPDRRLKSSGNGVALAWSAHPSPRRGPDLMDVQLVAIPTTAKMAKAPTSQIQVCFFRTDINLPSPKTMAANAAVSHSDGPAAIPVLRRHHRMKIVYQMAGTFNNPLQRKEEISKLFSLPRSKCVNNVNQPHGKAGRRKQRAAGGSAGFGKHRRGLQRISHNILISMQKNFHGGPCAIFPGDLNQGCRMPPSGSGTELAPKGLSVSNASLQRRMYR